MIVCTAAHIGGMQRIVCGLARQLTKVGWRVRTFFPQSTNDDALLEWCSRQRVDASVDPAVLGASAPHSWVSASELRRLVETTAPDVVNVHYGDNFLSIWDILAVRSAGLRRPLVASIHHPTAWRGTLWRKRAMTAVGGRGTSAIATFSGATRDMLLATPLPARKVHRIPCGIAVPADPPSRAEARRALGIRADEVVVGSLGRLVAHKGFDVLLDAMDCDELADTLLVIAGDGPLRSDLEARAVGTARVRFLGHVEDERLLYAAIDVFALPSRLEGFGLVYVEAAMHGVPSVATRVGGIPDAVIDGHTGVLVEVDDVRAVRAALVRLRSDPDLRRSLGERARCRARTDLDEVTMARRYNDLFQQLLKR